MAGILRRFVGRGWLAEPKLASERAGKSRPPGPIESASEVESLLAEEWNSLLCNSDDHKTFSEKLYGRMEKVKWDPSFLRFVLERHGGTVNGSTRADLHYWVVNVDERTRGIVRTGRRQIVRDVGTSQCEADC